MQKFLNWDKGDPLIRIVSLRSPLVPSKVCVEHNVKDESCTTEFNPSWSPSRTQQAALNFHQTKHSHSQYLNAVQKSNDVGAMCAYPSTGRWKTELNDRPSLDKELRVIPANELPPLEAVVVWFSCYGRIRCEVYFQPQLPTTHLLEQKPTAAAVEPRKLLLTYPPRQTLSIDWG